MYAYHLLDLVRRHLLPGQRALLVCPKAMVIADDVPNWSERVAQFRDAAGYFNRDYAWEFEGRHLGITWWGGYGVGANEWRDADVVFLFDEFHLPRRALVAMVQGLTGDGTTSSTGPLASITGLMTPNADVETLRNGHLLRWLKQMALRGAGRAFDENGVCGAQRLVVTGDYELLMANLKAVLPGAKIEVEQDPSASWLKRVTEELRQVSDVEVVRARDIAERLGSEWRDISSNVTRHRAFEAVLASAGWEYIRNRGRLGASFRRIVEEQR
jgi:hypothetical protein